VIEGWNRSQSPDGPPVDPMTPEEFDEIVEKHRAIANAVVLH
jgi:hypothetical protein